ncbi:MAG: glutamine--tRNA ligase/YqeY domain fusion protein [Candidatus Longimicrobiales bacterium M2_2A_002]
MDHSESIERLEGRDFLRTLVAGDLKAGRHGGRVVTRFPPEPNGFLHIGHAKSICLNFGIAEEVDGARCHLRFDDTNPETEDMKYVEAAKRDVAWLGFDWGDHLYFASDYFETMYEVAEHLITEGLAYVDSQSEEAIRENRGTVTEPGTSSPYRDRSVEESLDLFRRMRAGEFGNGAHVLRAKIDMASPNMLMRDPLLYRIRHAEHYRTGDDWCIYPMYDYAHPLEDAIEDVTHSFCTLEFEINRAVYDWVVENAPLETRPRQTEFARLNLDYTIMSKRKLLMLVSEGHVDGWDDPRMPTIAGIRRRGYTPGSIRAFADMIGVAKTDSRVDMGKLEFAIRDDLNDRAPRRMAVLRPLPVTVTNYPDGQAETIEAADWPRELDREGSRPVPFSGRILIEHDDFSDDPPAGWKRLAPGTAVRLRHGYVIRCDDVVTDEAGHVTELRCSYAPGSLDGPTPDGFDVRGAIHWVDADRSVPAEVRLYDRLFEVADPDAEAAASGQPFTAFLNPDSLVTVTDARVEPSLVDDPPGTRHQFERLGYFISDPEESSADSLVFNRTVTLRDTWSRKVAIEGESAGTSRDETAVTATAPDLSAEEHRKLREAAAPERPPDLEARRRRFADELGIDAEDAELLTRETATADFFEAALGAGPEDDAAGEPDAADVVAFRQRVANWMVNELPREIGGRPLANLPFAAADFGALVTLIADGTLSSSAARDVLADMVETGEKPAAIVDAKGLRQVSDADALAETIDGILSKHPDKVDAYRAGQTGLLGFFMGQVMRETGGKANPEVAKGLLQARLAG